MLGTARPSVETRGSTATASDLLPNRFNPESNHASLLSVRLKVIGSGPTPIGCCAEAGVTFAVVAPIAASTVTAAMRRRLPNLGEPGGALEDMCSLSCSLIHSAHERPALVDGRS